MSACLSVLCAYGCVSAYQLVCVHVTYMCVVSRSPDPFLHFRCCVIGRKGSGSFPKHKLFHPRTATVYLTPLWDDNLEVLIRCYTRDARARLYDYIASKTEMANCYFCKLLQTAAEVFSDLAR